MPATPLPIRSPDLLERLQELRREAPDGILVTDADGTLWSGDVGEDFFFAFVEHGDFRPRAREWLTRLGNEFALPVQPTAGEVAMALFRAYERGTFPEDRCCEMIALLAAGWTHEELRAFVRGVVVKRDVRSRLHPELLEVLAWASDSSVEVAVISASPEAIVAETIAATDLRPQSIAAVTPRLSRGGREVLAEVERPIPYAEGKVTALRKIARGRPVLAVFGDNAFDAAMMREARIPVGVRPKKRLLDVAHEVPNLVVLAPGKSHG